MMLNVYTSGGVAFIVKWNFAGYLLDFVGDPSYADQAARHSSSFKENARYNLNRQYTMRNNCKDYKTKLM